MAALAGCNKGDETIYIYVGEKGINNKAYSAYNGGGSMTNPYSDTNNGSGGGSTDIRLLNGNWNDSSGLASRIMVSAGGGGNVLGYTGGYGGTLTSVNTTGVTGSVATGATQTSGANFGIGASQSRSSGGGGYYGGGAGLYSGSGGSSYISGYTGSVAITAVDDISPKTGCDNGTTDIECSYHYSGKKFTNAIMKAGNEEMPTHDGTDVMIGNEGNGYARIYASDELKAIIDDYAASESVTPTENPGDAPELDVDYEMNGNISSTTNSVIMNDVSGYLNIQDGYVNIDKSGEYSAIVNRGNLTLGDNAIVVAKQSSNRGITNTISGNILDGSGTINTLSSYNIGLLNE